jgi:hypothetical protein
MKVFWMKDLGQEGYTFEQTTSLESGSNLVRKYD